MATNKSETPEVSEALESMDQKIVTWKKQYGDLYRYEAEDGKSCILRKPTRKILSMSAALSKGDQLKYNEVLIGQCWIEGDEALKNEDKYFFGLSQQIAVIIEVVEGELKKL